MTTTTTLVPIFATPFATVSLAGSADLNPALLSLFSLRAVENFRDPAVARDPLCFRSREDLFEWDHEAVTQLKREMLAALCSAVMAANLYSEAEFDALRVQARARFIIVRPDGCLPAASAPLASWYGVYCVAAPPPAPNRADGGALRLYESRLGTMFMDAANCRLRPPFASGHCVWRPVPDQVAAFPASLTHEVALNRTNAELVLVAARVRFAAVSQETMPPW